MTTCFVISAHKYGQVRSLLRSTVVFVKIAVFTVLDRTRHYCQIVGISDCLKRLELYLCKMDVLLEYLEVAANYEQINTVPLSCLASFCCCRIDCIECAMTLLSISKFFRVQRSTTTNATLNSNPETFDILGYRLHYRSHSTSCSIRVLSIHDYCSVLGSFVMFWRQATGKIDMRFTCSNVRFIQQSEGCGDPGVSP